MGLHNVELYNNLGLSCFYAQQYDMTLACMERALEMANDESLGIEIYHLWFRIKSVKKTNHDEQILRAANQYKEVSHIHILIHIKIHFLL